MSSDRWCVLVVYQYRLCGVEAFGLHFTLTPSLSSLSFLFFPPLFLHFSVSLSVPLSLLVRSYHIRLSKFDTAEAKAQEASAVVAERARILRSGGNAAKVTNRAARLVADLEALIQQLDQELTESANSYLM